LANTTKLSSLCESPGKHQYYYLSPRPPNVVNSLDSVDPPVPFAAGIPILFLRYSPGVSHDEKSKVGHS
jgi:hypothetical protein